MPGDSPIFPVIVVRPVLVIVEPAKTAKLEVVPRLTVGWAAIAIAGTASRTASSSVSSNGTCRILLIFISRLNPLYSCLFVDTCYSLYMNPAG